MVTTKKLHLKSIVYELLWFLKGDTNIKYLQENGVRDWFAKEWGELGPIYGKQWRDWQSQKFNVAKGEGYLLQIDQIHKLIVDIKNNPDSRRLMVSAWNVGEVEEVVLPPCHYGFQCYVQDGKLSLMWNQRKIIMRQVWNTMNLTYLILMMIIIRQHLRGLYP